MTIPMPPWPKVGDFDASESISDASIAYQHARAEAALARLRVAAKALREIKDGDADELTPYPDEYGGMFGPLAAKALAIIGDII